MYWIIRLQLIIRLISIHLTKTSLFERTQDNQSVHFLLNLSEQQ
jgi:hypothetical protein